MNKLIATIFASMLAAVASASSLLPGSINFNDTALWGKAVSNDLNDDGSSGGETHWYAGGKGNSSSIKQHTGKPSGYLSVSAQNGIHRTIPVTPATGPTPAKGRAIDDGIYIDTTVKLTAFADDGIKKTDDRDKMVLWVHQPTDGPTNFMITAGVVLADGSVEPTNYIGEVDASVEYLKSVRVVARIRTGLEIAEGVTGTGFELWLGDRRVTWGDGNTIFPSMQQAAEHEVMASRLYSLGFTGVCSAEEINFTSVDPIENPDYAKDDVSMLRESATLSVDGYGKTVASLYDFPLLVRVSESRIKGFYYSRAKSDGGDIRFTDENGKLLNHEIDTWVPGGESLVWVKVPYLRRGTRITMHWSLAAGGATPKNDSKAVWSDYVAVWHMNSATRGVAKDSTGNGHTATTTGGTLTALEEGPIGIGGEYAFVDSKQALQCANYDDELDHANVFTFTGWYYAKSVPSSSMAPQKCYPMFGTKNIVGFDNKSWVCGWAGYPVATTHYRYYFDGDGALESRAGGDLRTRWFHTALVYTNGVAHMFTDGILGQAGTVALTPTNLPFRVMGDGLCGDEIRIAKVPRSDAWILAEYEQATNLSYTAFGSAGPKGSDNYWIEEPSITPTAWSPDESSSISISGGRARYGATMLTYYNEAGEHLTKLPTEVGSYRAVFTAGDGTVHDVIEKVVNFVIFDRHAYSHVVGYDRMMLFNSDLTPGSEVKLQGFWDVDDATNLVWSHTTELWTGDGDFVEDGAFHTYYEAGTHARLWEFRHARIGNLFQSDAEGPVAGFNQLPWNSGYACRYDDSEMMAERQRYAGTLMLQNISPQNVDPEISESDYDPAAAYSPLYTNGIGTIYFDAVNGYTAYTNLLEVQVCRTAVEEGESVIVGEWETVPLTVYPVVDGAMDLEHVVSNANQAVLAVTGESGANYSFYRVRATVDIVGSVRFRIVRADENWGAAGVDGAGLIEIDNIIVSAPAMGVTLEQYGAPADRSDRVFRGQKAPFDIAFPGVDDLGQVHPLVKVNYIVNGTNSADTSFVGSLTCTYRWRYLNQKLGDWKEIRMLPSSEDPTRFVGEDALEGEGEGDLEYIFKADMNAPYYDYVDYTGLGLSMPGFTERRGQAQVNAAADGVYDEYNLSPALGTNYFVRVRAGQSSYEAMRLRVKRDDVDNVAEQVISMELVDNHIWRGYYQTPTNIEAGVLWQIETINPQSEVGVYNYETNRYYASDSTELPFNDVLVKGDTNTWGRVPVDATTGYLMFQYEDDTRSIAVIHADYQNVNNWTDANKADGDENGHFVGTSVEDATKSGASNKAQTYSTDFSLFQETMATNTNPSLWREPFLWKVTEDPTNKRAIERPFTSAVTPNGWGAVNGMWMPQFYRQLGDTKLALQLEGEGRGAITFQRATALHPRGIETFNFQARVAQSYDIYSFNYYRGTNEFYNLTNYTFAVPCVMRRRLDGEFEGLGTVSAVAYYDDGRGCYEVRAERTANNSVRLCLYKWTVSGSKITSTIVATNNATIGYTSTGLRGQTDKAEDRCSALFISCTNLAGSVRVQAGLLQNAITVANVGGFNLSGQKFYTVSYEDKADDRLTSGTMGVGSKDCPGVFAAPQFYNVVPKWQTGASATISFGVAEKQLLISHEDDYDQWTVRQGRLDTKEHDTAPQGYGFMAATPHQTVVIEVAPHSSQDYTVVATNDVTTFGFATYTNALYIAETVDVRVRTGGQRGDGGCDITVDDLEARQWRGESYNTDGNPDSSILDDGYGGLTNFVYTTAWISKNGGPIELSAMRTTEDAPASIRAPLMDGNSNRGLGLGMISFGYRDADVHTRLKVQVCTSSVDITTLATRTAEFKGWIDVTTIDFGDVSAEDRKQGMKSAYIGLHGVKGVMRIVIDPETVSAAHNASLNPDNSPTYGSIWISSITARDNPALDSGSWWGWNLRTTDDEMMWLLKDGTKTEPEVAGMSLGLNNSITDDIRADEKEVYHEHKPFMQTPVFLMSEIGEIAFKARKYSTSDPNPTVAIYGTTEPGTVTDDAEFELLAQIEITSDRYENYSYQTPVSKKFYSFRLAVTGVSGVDDAGPLPQSGCVERVLLDEVAVFEAVRTRVGFRNVRAFRNYLDFKTPVPDILTKEEQPMCNETWTVQAEIYKSQLGDEIVFDDTTEVFFRWYEGTYPWGGTNWLHLAEAEGNVARLARAEGTDKWIFRGGYLLASGAMVKPSTVSGTIVQYSLDVVYHNQKGETITNTLSAADWEKPEWYRGIDCNAQYSTDGSFSAYNILDTVPYGYAWFNEVNVYDGVDPDNNLAKTNQYIEVAIPREADITGWRIEFVSGGLSDQDPYYTNVVARFSKSSNDVIPTKNYALGGASNYVFITVGNQYSCDATTKANGTIDGYWYIPKSEFPSDQSQFYQNGVIYAGYPMGIQLVRASGIVEHQIVIQGTNSLAVSPHYGPIYSATNYVRRLREKYPDSSWYFPGDDMDRDPTCGVSVTQQFATAAADWDYLGKTPGRININEYINPDHPIPGGTSVLIYCDIYGDHIRHSSGGEYTTDSLTLVVQAGSETGTNINYIVDHWYEIDVVQTNGVTLSEYSGRGSDGLPVTVTVGIGCSNAVHVVAAARVEEELRTKYGLDENNKYTPAVINWLENGKTKFGEFADPYGEVKLAQFVGLSGVTNRWLALTEMYWLDMDPTVGDLILKAGMCKPPSPVVIKPSYWNPDGSTNVRVGVQMMISNTTADTDSPYYGKAWAPYTLRGITPGSDSATDSSNWTSETFKVTGYLNNGKDATKPVGSIWLPLRYFVFDENSFDERYQATIEVNDPFQPPSPGYYQGWYLYRDCQIFYRWDLDTRLAPVGAEVLRPNSIYSN